MPTRRYGLRTASGTCQETRIWVFGSAPKARWRPKGVTTEPCTCPVTLVLGAEPRVTVPDGDEQPASSPPPANAPADTRARRRVSFVRRYSYCSAMLIRLASCRGMPKSGMSMLVNFPARPNARHTYG